MGFSHRARGGVMDLARGCTQVEGILLCRWQMLLQVVFTMCPAEMCHIKVIQSDYMSITIMWVLKWIFVCKHG